MRILHWHGAEDSLSHLSYWCSIIDSIRIANLALNLSLSRKVSAMVHDSIRQRLSLLTKPSAETSCRRPKRSKSHTINWSLYDRVTLTQLPVARIPAPLKMALRSCGTHALRWCQLGDLVEKLPVRLQPLLQFIMEELFRFFA